MGSSTIDLSQKAEKSISGFFKACSKPWLNFSLVIHVSSLPFSLIDWQ
jgi:hypothetical protein